MRDKLLESLRSYYTGRQYREIMGITTVKDVRDLGYGQTLWLLCNFAYFNAYGQTNFDFEVTLKTFGESLELGELEEL